MREESFPYHNAQQKGRSFIQIPGGPDAHIKLIDHPGMHEEIHDAVRKAAEDKPAQQHQADGIHREKGQADRQPFGILFTQKPAEQVKPQHRALKTRAAQV